MSNNFYAIINRNTTIIWSGFAPNEDAAWFIYRAHTATPDTISVDELKKGRYGLRIVEWPG